MFEQLNEFLAVAKYKSFSEAAVSLFISQSSISRHVAELEKKLGVPLFDRTSRSVTLTEFGKLFVPTAENILKEMDAYREQANSLLLAQNISAKSVNVAVLPSFAAAKLGPIDFFFRDYYPQINLKFVEAEACDIENLLEEHKCDFATIRTFDAPFFAAPLSNMDSLVLYEEKYAVILPKSHPLATREEINIIELKDEFFIMPNDRMMLRKPLVETCRHSGFTPNVKYEFHLRENCLNMISRGFGISFGPEKVLERFPFDDLIAVRISPSISTRLCLIKRTDMVMTPEKQRFWDFMQTYFSPKT